MKNKLKVKSIRTLKGEETEKAAQILASSEGEYVTRSPFRRIVGKELKELLKKNPDIAVQHKHFGISIRPIE